MRRLRLFVLMMTLICLASASGVAIAEEHGVSDAVSEDAEVMDTTDSPDAAGRETLDDAAVDNVDADADDEVEELVRDDWEEEAPGPYDHTGAFVRLGYAYGGFDEDESDIQFTNGHGFVVALGWRHSAMLAAELSVTSFYGGKTDDFLDFDRVPLEETDKTKKLTSTEFSLNAKFYPLGIEALREMSQSPLLDNLPEIVQPYMALGIGWSLQDVDTLDQTRPAFRFAGGIDVIVWEPIAFTIEGGYTRHEHLVRRNRGTHIEGTRFLNVGAMVRF